MYELLRKVIGWIRLIFHFALPKNKNLLDQVIGELSPTRCVHPRGRNFVMMVGFSKSGKTTFIKNHKELPKYYQISSQRIHDLINKTFGFLNDDKSVRGKAYWERQLLTHRVRSILLGKAFRKGFCVLSDSANLKRANRLKTLKMAKKQGYETYIFYITVPEVILLQRLANLDEQLKQDGKPETWIKLYSNLQKKRLQKPLVEEADCVKECNGY